MLKTIISQMQPRSMMLPGVTFFKPQPEFVEWLSNLDPKPRLIIDVGAGNGTMSRVLTSKGFACLAIDICTRPQPEFQIYNIDALTFDYPAESLPIMARPCHGYWVEYAIEQAMQTVPRMLYVGLKKNISSDLYGMKRHFKITRESFQAGQDGEIVVRIESK